MLTRDDLALHAERLQRAVAHAVTDIADDRFADLGNLLDQTTHAVESFLAPSDQLTASERMAYFPPPASPPTAAELAQARRDWRDAVARGTSHREDAIAQVGPVLTPAQTLNRLGVSSVTLSKWRRAGKLLGLRFDDHQFLYPTWQFVDSPEQGERGILRHLDRVLLALGDCSAWTKARFLRTPHPRLHGASPLDTLALAPDQSTVDFVLHLARHAGETGQ